MWTCCHENLFMSLLAALVEDVDLYSTILKLHVARSLQAAAAALGAGPFSESRRGRGPLHSAAGWVPDVLSDVAQCGEAACVLMLDPRLPREQMRGPWVAAAPLLTPAVAADRSHSDTD